MGCNDSKVGIARSGMARSRNLLSTVVLDLCDEQVFTATSLVGNSAFDEYVLTGDDFASLGPAIVDIVIHAEGLNFSPQFSYDVVLQYRYKYGNWATVSLFAAIQTTGAYVISLPYATRASFGMDCRLVLRTQVASGTATQKGNLSISAAVRLYTGC